MLPLRSFQLLQPTTLEGALEAAAAREGACLLAGGTDLIVNLKLGLRAPDALISLRRVTELSGVSELDGEVCIGARTTLQDVASAPIVQRRLPALAAAAAAIASPQIRRMGTLGGNLCLESRCRYVNQSELFREALGGCLKSHGTRCYVVPGGTSCVAALAADTVAPLVAHDAVVEIQGRSASRRVRVEELRAADGVRSVTLEPGEVLVRVRVPTPGPHTRCVFRKWAVRQAIDYPLVSLALRLDLSDDEGRMVGGKLVLSTLGPKPRIVPLDALAGAPLDAELVERIGAMAFEHAKTLPNLPYDPAYRRQRTAVEARRAARSMLQPGSA